MRDTSFDAHVLSIAALYPPRRAYRELIVITSGLLGLEDPHPGKTFLAGLITFTRREQPLSPATSTHAVSMSPFALI